LPRSIENVVEACTSSNKNCSKTKCDIDLGGAHYHPIGNQLPSERTSNAGLMPFLKWEDTLSDQPQECQIKTAKCLAKVKNTIQPPGKLILTLPDHGRIFGSFDRQMSDVRLLSLLSAL
jgi:hypothetical protein